MKTGTAPTPFDRMVLDSALDHAAKTFLRFGYSEEEIKAELDDAIADARVELAEAAQKKQAAQQTRRARFKLIKSKKGGAK